MEWHKIGKKLPESGEQVLIWRFEPNKYRIAHYVVHDPATEGFVMEGPVWRFDSRSWAFAQPSDEWTYIPSRTDPVTLGQKQDDPKFWNKVKDKKPPVAHQLLLGWVEEGEFFYTVARIEPHVDDPETLMWTDCVNHGLPHILLTNHYWADVPSIWPGLPAAILH